MTLTDSARKWLQQFLSACASQEPVMTQPIIQLAWDKSPGEEYNWSLGAQHREVAISTKGFYLGECDGFEICVIQGWILDAIDNRTLDIDDEGRVTFLPPVPPELIDPKH